MASLTMPYAVSYHKTANPHKTYFQNQVRTIGTRLFRTEAEARAFAATVLVKAIYNPAGKLI